MEKELYLIKLETGEKKTILLEIFQSRKKTVPRAKIVAQV